MPTLTITTTTNQANRIVDAFGKYLGSMDVTDPDNPVPRDATQAEVKASVINYIRQTVYGQERKTAMAAAQSGIPDIDPT